VTDPPCHVPIDDGDHTTRVRGAAEHLDESGEPMTTRWADDLAATGPPSIDAARAAD
jgi:hypothetical protein